MSTRVRAIAAAVAVLAVLVYLNLLQVDDENELALRGSGVLSANVERVIRDRQRQAISDAVYECVALTLAGCSAIVAIAGGRIHRPAARGSLK